MKKFRITLMLCAMAGIDGTVVAQERPGLTVVPSVDLQRYAGMWYEIARLPNRFQEDCASDVTAVYTLLDDGTIKVTNRCKKQDGEFMQAEGLARPADDQSPNTKLKVRFAPAFLSFLPFVWGDYWIIDLAADYSYAVIGEPSREYLWILSRSAAPPSDTLRRILDRLAVHGYEPGNLIMTKQLVR